MLTYQKKILSNQKLLLGLNILSLPFYEHYAISKHHKLRFSKSTTSKGILDLVHSEVWEASITSLEGPNYFVLFVDDYFK